MGNSADRFFIGIVGDSWVAGGKLDDGIRKALYDASIDAIVRSRGTPGATIDQIERAHRTLLAYIKQNYSDRRAVVLIEGGLNDCIGYGSPQAYAAAVQRMVDATNHARATPVVLTIPLFNRSKLRRSPRAWLRRLLSGWPAAKSPDVFNAALGAKIGKALVIDILEMTCLELRDDTGAHLPAQGFDRLAARIGQELVLAVNRFGAVAHGAP
jgi:hypothetical protein